MNEIDGAKGEILDNFQRGRKEDNEKHEARHEESMGLLQQIAGSGVNEVRLVDTLRGVFEESAKKIQIARPFGEGDLDLACAPRNLSYSTSEVSLGHSSIAASTGTGTGTGTRISAPLSEEEREGYKRQIADLQLQNRLTRGETRDERVMGSDPKPANLSKATVRSVQENVARFQKGRKMRAHQEAGKLQPRR